MKVILDHNLSPKIARALHALFAPEHEVHALRDRFPPDTSDAELIAALAKDGRWALVSGDREITRNAAHAAAFRQSKLIGFFLAKGLYKATVVKQMERLLVLWDGMVKIADTVEGGAMFELPMRSNRLRQIR